MPRRWLVVAILLAACERPLRRLQIGGISSAAAIVFDGPGADREYFNRRDAIALNWIGFQSDDGLASYDVNLSTGVHCRGDVSAAVSADATSIELTGLNLAPGLRYFACVRAVSKAGSKSEWVASSGFVIDDTPPAVPAALYASAEVNQVALAWTPVADADSGLAAYELAHCEGSCDALTPAYTDILTNAFTVIDVTNCVDYGFAVRAVDRAGNASAFSPLARSHSITERPQQLVAVPGFGTVEVAFSPVAGAQDYDVCLSSLPDACAGTAVRTGGLTKVFVDGVPPDTSTVAVRAIRDGCVSAASADVGVSMVRPVLASTFAGAGDPDSRFGWAIARRFSYSDFVNVYYVSAPLGLTPDQEGDIYGCVLTPLGCGGDYTGPSAGSLAGNHMRHVDLFYGDYSGQRGFTVAAYRNGFHLINGSMTNGGGTLDAGNEAPSLGIFDDRTGDGLPKILVGAPGASGNQGRVAIFSPATGSEIGSIAGTNRFGLSVDSAGDLDGDGIAEILASNAPSSGDGALRVLSGATGHALLDTVTVPPRSNVRRAGDVDGDNVGDFAVGSPFADAAGQTLVGRLSLYSGRTRTLIRVQDGQDIDGALGRWLQPAGDLDGDGAGDLLAGAPVQGYVTDRSLGSLFAFSGRTGALLFSLQSEVNGDLFGSSAMIGDANIDGALELLVGAPAGAATRLYRYAFPQALGIVAGERVEVEDVTTERGAVHLMCFNESTIMLKARGGSPPYRWSLLSNRSGGELTASGAYTCGSSMGAYDVVRLTDARLRSVDTRIVVSDIMLPTQFLQRPTKPTLTVNGGSIHVSWGPVPSAIGYIVEWRAPTAGWTTLPVVTTASTQIVGVTTGAHIQVRVKAQDMTNDSAWSALAKVSVQ